jgi:regulator of RNase E activity RraA
MEDADPHPIGSFWGEVMGNAHKALGCVGTLTNGAVRDVLELRRLGFFAIASRLVVSHAFVHVTRIGGKVGVGGMEVTDGDLLHADVHGALRIPTSIDLDRLLAVAASIEALEREMFSVAQSPTFSVRAYLDKEASVAGRWPRVAEGAEPRGTL